MVVSVRIRGGASDSRAGEYTSLSRFRRCGGTQRVAFTAIVGCSVNEEQATLLVESGLPNEIVQTSAMLYQVFGSIFGRTLMKA